VSAALTLQKAIRARLVSTSAVTDLVPASAILDRNQRPAPSPSIILGEAQVLDEGDIARKRSRVFHTIHVWKLEASLAGVTAINATIREALRDRLSLDAGHHVADLYIADSRAMRDPDGETSHGVVTLEALIVEEAS